MLSTLFGISFKAAYYRVAMLTNIANQIFQLRKVRTKPVTTVHTCTTVETHSKLSVYNSTILENSQLISFHLFSSNLDPFPTKMEGQCFREDERNLQNGKLREPHISLGQCMQYVSYKRHICTTALNASQSNVLLSNYMETFCWKRWIHMNIKMYDYALRVPDSVPCYTNVLQGFIHF